MSQIVQLQKSKLGFIRVKYRVHYCIVLEKENNNIQVACSAGYALRDGV